jgi:hypothetical protein
MIALKDGATVPQNGHVSPAIYSILQTDPDKLQNKFNFDLPETGSKSPTPDKTAAEREDEREKEDSSPFPADCLPLRLKWLADNVSASTKMPAVIPYTAGLACISSALGAGLALETKKGEFIFPNTYILPVVNSGLGKSRSSKPMLAPLYAKHDELQEQWKERFAEIKAELDDIDSEIDQKKKELARGNLTDAGRKEIKDKLKSLYEVKEEYEAESKKPELYTGNTTEAKLAILLNDNNEVLSAISSEAGSAIQILAGKYSSGQKGNINTEDTLMLSSYCQERYKGDRSTTQSIELRAPTVNLYWMFQSRYVPMLYGNQSLATGGFLARCLAFNSKADPQEETGDEPDFDSTLIKGYRESINELFKFRFAQSPKFTKPTKAATDLMRAYHNECVRLAKGDLIDIQQFPLRWRENAWKLALCIHAMDDDPRADLSVKAAEKAVRIGKWFTDQFLALMCVGREDQLEQDGLRLLNYVNKNGEVYKPGQSVSMAVRDIARNWSVGSEDIRKIVSMNIKRLRIESVTPPRGGRASERVLVCR